MRHQFKKHKYNAKPTMVDGIRFDSKKEAQYYRELKLRQRAGEIVGFLRQTPIHLPGGTKLVIDFQEFHADGTVHFVDTKGVETAVFKVKLREAKAAYPWLEIEIV